MDRRFTINANYTGLLELGQVIEGVSWDLTLFPVLDI